MSIEEKEMLKNILMEIKNIKIIIQENSDTIDYLVEEHKKKNVISI